MTEGNRKKEPTGRWWEPTRERKGGSTAYRNTRSKSYLGGPEAVIEVTFEQWLHPGRADFCVPSDDPRLLIYECCVAEIAARAEVPVAREVVGV